MTTNEEAKMVKQWVIDHAGERAVMERWDYQDRQDVVICGRTLTQEPDEVPMVTVRLTMPGGWKPTADSGIVWSYANFAPEFGFWNVPLDHLTLATLCSSFDETKPADKFAEAHAGETVWLTEQQDDMCPGPVVVVGWADTYGNNDVIVAGRDGVGWKTGAADKEDHYVVPRPVRGYYVEPKRLLSITSMNAEQIATLLADQKVLDNGAEVIVRGHTPRFSHLRLYARGVVLVERHDGRGWRISNEPATTWTSREAAKNDEAIYWHAMPEMLSIPSLGYERAGEGVKESESECSAGCCGVGDSCKSCEEPQDESMPAAEPKELKVGDVVELKSGGPDMTVDSIGNGSLGQWCSCVWFQYDSTGYPIGGPLKHTFRRNALHLLTDEERGIK